MMILVWVETFLYITAVSSSETSCIHTSESVSLLYIVLCVCVGGGGGIVSCHLFAVIPGPLAKAMPIARHGTVGVATHHVPCSSHSDVQKPLAFKTKTDKSTFVNKSPAHSSGSHGIVHAKSRTRIGCWNVGTRPRPR